MYSCYLRFCEQLFLMMNWNVHNSQISRRRVFSCFNVWILFTHLSWMPKLFTTQTLNLFLLILVFKNSIKIIVIIYFFLVLLNSASSCVFCFLSTTPPYFSTPFTVMRPTAPVKVIFFIILSVTKSTNFSTKIDVTTCLQFSF